mmetsp:Transcript_28037/g.82057  ORF Transcript_28037/g.82057 Transcript_28037/m.82057 type:complete len:98 (+) Transcript_28037:53-346(+)
MCGVSRDPPSDTTATLQRLHEPYGVFVTGSARRAGRRRTPASTGGRLVAFIFWYRLATAQARRKQVETRRAKRKLHNCQPPCALSLVAYRRIDLKIF